MVRLPLFPFARAVAVALAIGLTLPAVGVCADPIKVSAKEVTAAFVKDPNAAAKKYGDAMNPKEVVVTGTVASVVNGKYGKIARLQGDGKVVVSCLLRKEDEGSVKKGQQIVIQGRCRGYFKSEKLVDLNGGVLVKEKGK
jgi:hypothetical protein